MSVCALNFVQHLSVLALAGLGLTTAQPALADDWVAERVRGSVRVYQDGDWVPLQRGDVVYDNRYIKTLGDGRVQFTRGAEAIEQAGHTLIQILDRDGQQFTNVHQHYGKVAEEAERLDVNHFSVTTPYLPAIVKGTQFVVQSGSTGASVSVDRGQVNVADPATGTSVDISLGQAASVDPTGSFTVSATGGVELPIIHNSAGGVIEEQSSKPDSVGAPSSSEGNSGNGNGNGNGNGGNASTRGGKGNGSGGSNSDSANGENDKGNKGNAGGNGNSGSDNGNGNAGGQGNGDGGAKKGA